MCEAEAPKVVDLFCGAGGLLLGTHEAGFEVVLAVDNDEDLTSSFSLNFPRVDLQHLDMLDEPMTGLDRNLNGTQIDGVVGSPPCQGFSNMGARDVADPRNALLGRFMRAVDVLRPKFFLMENVPGLAHQRNSSVLESALELLPSHYKVLDGVVLNAADYGAPTDRPRLITIGYNPGCVDDIVVDDLEAAEAANHVTVRDAIADIPSPLPTNDLDSLPYRSSRDLSLYAKRMRAVPSAGLSNDEARELLRRGYVTGVQGTVHSPAVSERFANVPVGKCDQVSKYRRLEWSGRAPVLRAGTGRDRGSFQAARPIHPEEPRVITVREAARLQGFPDWFRFSNAKWHSHRMIGNSVSPVFAEAVLSVIRQRVDCG